MQQDHCLQTTNLDGESNLKTRAALKETKGLKQPSELSNFKGVVVCQSPDQPGFELLDKFDSQMRLAGAGSQQPLSLSADNLMLQATKLRNTDYVYALVVYTGNETKFGKNKRAPPSKFTQTDALINDFSMIIFFFQLTLVLAFGIVGNLWKDDNGRNMWFLRYDSASAEPFYQVLIIPLRFLLLNSTMIPISLKVTLDLCKLFYAKFINADPKLWDAETGTKTNSNSTALSEDLGQIEYVLSDKTGTLTENVMVLKVCSVMGKQFGVFDAEADNLTGGGGALRPGTVNDKGVGLSAKGMMEDPNMRKQVATDRASGNTGACAVEFLRCIALNNTVIPSTHDTPTGGVQRAYKASSPDEEALVDAASHYGVALLGREADIVEIAVPGPAAGAPGLNMSHAPFGKIAGLGTAADLGEPTVGGSARMWVEQYQQLAEFEFSSDRKRMSVIVKARSVGGHVLSGNQGGGGVHGGLRIYVKGADDMILQRLAPGQLRPGPGGKSAVEKQIDEYAASGLRTLVMAYRDISDAEWAAFQADFNAAKAAMTGREEATNACYERLEQNLTLLGATAIEDKLQDAVPETISLLKEANIKIWMCTGDKYSTAQTIAQTCALWPAGSDLLSIEGNDRASVGDSLQGHISALQHRGMRLRYLPEPMKGPCQEFRIRAGCACRPVPPGQAVAAARSASSVSVPNPVTSGRQDSSDSTSALAARGGSIGYTVIVRGSTLHHALLHHRKEFASVCLSADAVICCRVTPKQKAQLVKVVRDAGHMTLAIGDGGNDVVMIQEAHIGVGIRGKEGLQAARSSDYAVPFFRTLQRLILVHGRYSYYRTAMVAQYSFYKSFMFCFLQIGFGFVSGFAGVSLFNSLCVAAYNALLFVPIVYFFLDKDIDEGTALGYPQAYLQTQRGEFMNYGTMGKWFVRAFFQAVATMVLCLLYPPLGSEDAHHEILGLIVFFGYLWVQDFTMLFMLRRVTWFNFGTIFGLHALAFVGGVALNVLRPFQGFIDYYTLNHALSLASFWLVNALMLGACCVLVEAVMAWSLRSGSSSDNELVLWDSRNGSAEAPQGTLGGKPGPRLTLRQVRGRGNTGDGGSLKTPGGPSDGASVGRSPRPSDADTSVNMELPLLKGGSGGGGSSSSPLRSAAGHGQGAQKHPAGGRDGGHTSAAAGVAILADGTRRADNPLHSNSPPPGHRSLDVVSREGSDTQGDALYVQSPAHGVVVNGKAVPHKSAQDARHTDPTPLGRDSKRGSMVSDSGETDEPAGSDASDDFDAGLAGGGERDDDVAALPGDSLKVGQLPPGGGGAVGATHAKYQYYVRSPRKSLTPGGAKLHQ